MQWLLSAVISNTSPPAPILLFALCELSMSIASRILLLKSATAAALSCCPDDCSLFIINTNTETRRRFKVCSNPIPSLGSDVKPLALSPAGDVVPGVVVRPVHMYSWIGWVWWDHEWTDSGCHRHLYKLTSDLTTELNCKVHLDILYRKYAI